MLRSPGIAGISFIKGRDNEGNERLIVQPVTEDGAVIEKAVAILTELHIMPGKAESAGIALDHVIMKQMIERFRQAQRPGEFSTHVYGKKVLEQLLLQSGAKGIHIAKGLDENGQEHLVLMAIDKKGKAQWAEVWNHGSGCCYDEAYQVRK